MPQKMMSCVCGNTELEKVDVNLLRSNNSEPLELIALLCRGSGCGRVTFRPMEVASTDTQPADVRSAETKTAEARTTEVRSSELPPTESRSNGMPKTKPDAPNYNRDAMKHLIALFEQVYTERLVYKVIAERDPGCSVLVEGLKADRGIRDGIMRTFMPIYQSIERNQDFMKLLESLPSTGIKKTNATVAAMATSE